MIDNINDDSFEVEVDGSSYVVKIHSETEEENKVYTFSTVLDGKNYQLSAEISTQLIEDLERVMGLDANKELQNILEEEIELEISRYYDGVYWNSKLEREDKE